MSIQVVSDVLPCSCLRLASARERKGMSLEAIARSTRIASGYLEAIEAEDFGKLPGGVYNTSYIRQYARAIGYDERVLLDQYHAKAGLRTDQTPPVLEIQKATRGGNRLGAAMSLFRGHTGEKPRGQHPA